jgi:glucose-1-phosphate thymidylyltransferase
LIIRSFSIAWLDTGTHSSLLDAGNFVRTITERQGLQVGSPDEVAYQLKWICREKLREIANNYGKNNYGEYLTSICVHRQGFGTKSGLN